MSNNPWDLPTPSSKPSTTSSTRQVEEDASPVWSSGSLLTSTRKSTASIPDWAQPSQVSTPTSKSAERMPDPDWSQQETQSLSHNTDDEQVPIEVTEEIERRWLSKRKGWSGIQNTILFVSLFFGFAVAGVVFALTCMQFSNVESTSQGSKIYALKDGGSACSQMPYTPLRFRFEQDPEYLECGWHSASQALRVIISLLAVFSPLICIFAVVKYKRWVIYLFAILSFVFSGCFLWRMITDANDVRASSTWCEDGMAGVQLSPPDIKVICSYIPYIITCLMDAVAGVVWLIVGIVSFRYVWKHMISL